MRHSIHRTTRTDMVSEDYVRVLRACAQKVNGWLNERDEITATVNYELNLIPRYEWSS